MRIGCFKVTYPAALQRRGGGEHTVLNHTLTSTAFSLVCNCDHLFHQAFHIHFRIHVSLFHSVLPPYHLSLFSFFFTFMASLHFCNTVVIISVFWYPPPCLHHHPAFSPGPEPCARERASERLINPSLIRAWRSHLSAGGG